MPRIVSVQPGGEKYLGFALAKLRQLKSWMKPAGLRSMSKHFWVNATDKIWIKAVNIGNDTWWDWIRIESGSNDLGIILGLRSSPTAVLNFNVNNTGKLSTIFPIDSYNHSPNWPHGLTSTSVVRSLFSNTVSSSGPEPFSLTGTFDAQYVRGGHVTATYPVNVTIGAGVGASTGTWFGDASGGVMIHGKRVEAGGVADLAKRFQGLINGEMIHFAPGVFPAPDTATAISGAVWLPPLIAGDNGLSVWDSDFLKNVCTISLNGFDNATLAFHPVSRLVEDRLMLGWSYVSAVVENVAVDNPGGGADITDYVHETITVQHVERMFRINTDGTFTQVDELRTSTTQMLRAIYISAAGVGPFVLQSPGLAIYGVALNGSAVAQLSLHASSTFLQLRFNEASGTNYLIGENRFVARDDFGELATHNVLTVSGVSTVGAIGAPGTPPSGGTFSTAVTMLRGGVSFLTATPGDPAPALNWDNIVIIAGAMVLVVRDSDNVALTQKTYIVKTDGTKEQIYERSLDGAHADDERKHLVLADGVTYAEIRTLSPRTLQVRRHSVLLAQVQYPPVPPSEVGVDATVASVTLAAISIGATGKTFWLSPNNESPAGTRVFKVTLQEPADLPATASAEEQTVVENTIDFNGSVWDVEGFSGDRFTPYSARSIRPGSV